MRGLRVSGLAVLATVFAIGFSAIPAASVVTETKLTAGDGAALDELGYSVSINGDTAVAGAPFSDVGTTLNAGSVYVFVRDAWGTWTQQQRLTASDGQAFDNLGYSVAISGDTVVAGARFDDDKGTSSGSAYVFVRDPSGVWTQQKLTASDGATGDQFGYSVAIFSDTVVVGAPRVDGGGIPTTIDSGAAYVFVRDAWGTWTEQAKLTAGDAADFDEFGTAVSVSGDTALIGAPLKDCSGFDDGAAYVFVRDAWGTWTQEQKLTASDGAEEDEFGYAVSLNGDTALIGAYLDDTNGLVPIQDAGSAYVFVRVWAPWITWSQEAKLTASNGDFFDEFGYSVSVSGDTALIGAPFDDCGLGVDSGSAYVFVRDAWGTWSQQTELTACDAAAFDEFGFSVANECSTAVVGAPFDSNDNGDAAGSIYIFEAW